MSSVIPREQLCGYLHTIGTDLESDYRRCIDSDADLRYSEIARCLMYIPSVDASEYMWGSREASLDWARTNLGHPLPIRRWTQRDEILGVVPVGFWIFEVEPARLHYVDRIGVRVLSTADLCSHGEEPDFCARVQSVCGVARQYFSFYAQKVQDSKVGSFCGTVFSSIFSGAKTVYECVDGVTERICESKPLFACAVTVVSAGTVVFFICPVDFD